MNCYSLIYYTPKDKEVEYHFVATSLQDAYDKAAEHLINNCEFKNEESYDLLDSSDMDSWNDVTEHLFDTENYDIFDIQEKDEDCC